MLRIVEDAERVALVREVEAGAVLVHPRDRADHAASNGFERDPSRPARTGGWPRRSRCCAVPTTTSWPTTGCSPATRTRPISTSSWRPGATSRPWPTSRPPSGTRRSSTTTGVGPTPDPAATARAWLGLGLARRALGQPDYIVAIEEAGRLGRRLRDVDVVAEAALASIWPGNFFVTAGRTQPQLVELGEDALALVDPTIRAGRDSCRRSPRT